MACSARGQDMSRLSISVAMAVYNGELYLKEQIDSILVQLERTDELVISYNESTDNTLAILNEYAENDPRIKVFECSEKGVIANFENAIKNCSNDIVFLSDQDDVWVKNKVNVMLSNFDNDEIGCVIHRPEFVDSELKPIEVPDVEENVKYIKPVNILVKNEAQGSCMAFRTSYKDKILPIPRDLPMHDSWIALVISNVAKVKLIPDKLILYRQHGNNVSPRSHQKIGKMISDRRKLSSNINKRKSQW